MTEPRIEVGILHRKEIVFRLNGKFSVSPSDIITEGEHKVIRLSGNRILWNGKEYDSLMFIPENENCSFDLNSVTIGVDFHWEREETQRKRRKVMFSGRVESYFRWEGDLGY